MRPPPTLIRVESISKRFARSIKPSLRNTFEDVTNQFLGRPVDRQLRKDEFWALRDINFTVNKGETVAVIGDNGAGKSTLLKLLMGRMLPTTGKIYTHGTLSALTVLGLGFDPVLSGMENIFINAAALGMSRKNTSQILDKIVDFAELGEFIDMPVGSYSSGMKARLGYAVAAHMNPDVLLLDEVLAVGDIRFRRKCRLHLKGFIDAGGTMLIVTHDLQAVQTFCTRCIVLEKGNLIYDGDPTEGLHLYLSTRNEEGVTQESTAEDLMQESKLTSGLLEEPLALAETSESAAETTDADLPSQEEIHDHSAMPIDLTPVPTFTNGTPSPVFTEPDPSTADVLRLAEEEQLGQPAEHVRTEEPVPRIKPVVLESVGIRPLNSPVILTGEPVELSMKYRALEEIPRVVWGFTFASSDGLVNIGSMLVGFGEEKIRLAAGAGVLRCRVARLPLRAGKYALKAGISETDTGFALSDVGWRDSPLIFSVKDVQSMENNIHQVIGDMVTFDFEVV